MPRSTRDNIEINQHEHDEKLDAKRVLIVGGEFKIDEKEVTKALSNAISKAEFKIGTEGTSKIETIKVPEIVKEIQVVQVPVQTFVPQVQIIEVPKIMIETKIVEVEKPVIVTELKIVEIEKPIIVEKESKTSSILKIVSAVCILINLALVYRVFIN